MKQPKLTDAEIQSSLSTINGWAITGGDTLTKTFTFPDFGKAIAFVNNLADKAEAANHHPDLNIRYNKVTVSLSTHDSGGITVNDFTLAKQADTLA